MLRARCLSAKERAGRSLKRPSSAALRTILFVLATFGFGFALVFWRDNIVDPDCFYHTAHARLYWENGPLYRDFPWAAFSIISRERADLWWGFHVLFSPLGLIRDPVVAMRVGIAVAASSHVLILGLAYRRLSLSPWWALGSATVSAGLMSRLATLRPQVLSSALIPLLFAELWNRSILGAALVGAALGFFHPTLAYVLLPIFALTALGPGRKKSKAPEMAALLSIIFCALLRPGPEGGLVLLRVQTLDLLKIKRLGVILNFGNELSPAQLGYFLFGAAVPLALVAIGLLYARRETFRGPAVASFLLTLVFLGVFLGITKRGVDQVAPFGFLTFALFATTRTEFPRMAVAFAAIACGFTVWDYRRDKLKSITPLTRRFEGASRYLASHTSEGTVVYHTIWSHFADLFFWNRRNRYLGGMDPTFQYAISAENYWMCTPVHPQRRPGWVGKEVPPNGLDIPLYMALPNYFGTRWLVAAHGAELKVVDELRSDPKHYAERYRDETASVFEVVNSKP